MELLHVHVGCGEEPVQIGDTAGPHIPPYTIYMLIFVGLFFSINPATQSNTEELRSREVPGAAVELEPPNIKEGVANDIDSTAICNLVTGYEVMWIFLFLFSSKLNIFL